MEKDQYGFWGRNSLLKCIVMILRNAHCYFVRERALFPFSNKIPICSFVRFELVRSFAQFANCSVVLICCGLIHIKALQHFTPLVGHVSCDCHQWRKEVVFQVHTYIGSGPPVKKLVLKVKYEGIQIQELAPGIHPNQGASPVHPHDYAGHWIICGSAIAHFPPRAGVDHRLRPPSLDSSRCLDFRYFFF